MTKTIECTLQEAVEKCQNGEDDGMIYPADDRNNNGRKYTKYDLLNLKVALFKPVDFGRTWLYEPPQKSAFQEWNDIEPVVFRYESLEDNIRDKRKEGWNAAIEVVLELQKADRTWEQIEKLKEP